MNEDKTSTQEEAASQKLEQKNMPIWHSPAWLTAIAGIVSIFLTVPDIVGNYLSKQQDIELAKQKTESLHLGNTDSKQKQEFEIINNTLARQGDERIFMLRYLAATIDDADAKKWAEKEVEMLEEIANEKEKLEQEKLCSEEAKKQNAKVDRLRQIAGLPNDIDNDNIPDFTQLDMTVNVPDQKYSFGFPPFDLDDYISFNPAGNWFNDVVWSTSPVPAGWNVSIDEEHVVNVTSPPNETNDVPITFNAHLAGGGEQCGIYEEVIFIANHPPVLCDAAAFQCLWSPNHKGYTPVPLTGFVCDPDGDAVTARILSITSDEPVGKDPYDASGIGTDTAWLRQERDVHGDGRVYVVTFVASDGRGGETTMTLPARVPHDNSGDCEAVDSGQNYDATQENFAAGKKK